MKFNSNSVRYIIGMSGGMALVFIIFSIISDKKVLGIVFTICFFINIFLFINDSGVFPNNKNEDKNKDKNNK